MRLVGHVASSLELEYAVGTEGRDESRDNDIQGRSSRSKLLDAAVDASGIYVVAADANDPDGTTAAIRSPLWSRGVVPF